MKRELTLLEQLEESFIKGITYYEVEGIDTRDYPDFCDAFISYAEYEGKEISEAELDMINDNHRDWVYECVYSHLF